MRKQGRKPELPQETINKMVEEYLTTDKTAEEVGEKYGTSSWTVRYHANKRKNEVKRA